MIRRCILLPSPTKLLAATVKPIAFEPIAFVKQAVLRHKQFTTGHFHASMTTPVRSVDNKNRGGSTSSLGLSVAISALLAAVLGPILVLLVLTQSFRASEAITICGIG